MRDHTEILISRGAATPSTFDLIDKLLEDFPQGASVLSFQLPFPLHLMPERFAVPGQRKGTIVYFQFQRIYTAVDEKCVLRVYDDDTWSKSPLPERSRIFECTQCIALMPLWGTRMDYYRRYLDCVRTGRMNDIVIRAEANPYHRHMPGSVNAYMFEADMAARALPEVRHSIRLFLRQYIITSLDEVPLPDELFSLFASTAPGRAFSFGESPSLIFGLLSGRESFSIRTVTAVDIQNALAWPARDFSSFELQIFALKRLADDGEPAVALLGLMALIEWFLNDGRSEKKLFDLLRDPRYDFVPSDIRQTLDNARLLRNKIVHETPTQKLTTHNPNAYSTRKGVPNTDSLMSLHAFKEAFSASFELYKHVNRRRTENSPLHASAADPSHTLRDQSS